MAIAEGLSAGGVVAGVMAQSQAYAKQEAQLSLLKKSMDVQGSAVMALMDGVDSFRLRNYR